MCCENFREISWTDLVYGALVDWWTPSTVWLRGGAWHVLLVWSGRARGQSKCGGCICPDLLHLRPSLSTI